MATLFSPSLRLQSWGCMWALGRRSQSGRRFCVATMDVGTMRWRKGETRALNIAEGKKRKKQVLPCFCSSFFFIYTMETPPWRCHGRACRGPALGRCTCVWGGSCLLPGSSHALSSRTLLQAGRGFLSPASSPPARGFAGPSA